MAEASHQIWVAEDGLHRVRHVRPRVPVRRHVTWSTSRRRSTTTRCISCGMCATKCPKHVIHDALGIFAAAE